MPNAPDIAGFRDAQNRLREVLGQDVTFHVPEAVTWDPAVALDPETGQPYDPTTVPTSGGGHADVVIRVSVVFRTIRRGAVEDQVIDQPVGVMNDGTVALLIAQADYAAIQDATEFVLNGKDYRITDILPDGIGEIDRYVAFGEAR